jgi:hypothetical protein
VISLFTNEIDKNDIPVKITENVDYSYMGPVVGCPMPAYRRTWHAPPRSRRDVRHPANLDENAF